MADLAATARGLALDRHAVAVIGALEEAGLTPVLLKGPGLARRLYADEPLRRRYSDVDVLVAPDEFDRAEEVLAALGHSDVAADFPSDEWLPHERSWRGGPAGLTVDLHRGFAGVDDPETLHRLLAGHAEPMVLEGAVVRVPDAVGCALLVGLHAAAPGRGRKALADLAQGLQRLNRADWTAAARWAAATGSSEAFATGLRRTADGALLADELTLVAAPTLLSRAAERLDLVLLHRSLHALRRVPGLRGKVRYVIRRLVPTPGFLRTASATARRGRLGLAAAYVVRPLRLLQPARRARSTPGGRRRPRLALEPGLWTRSTPLTAAWTWSALRRARRALAGTPLADVDLPGPPVAPGDEPTVRRMLRRGGATCLERALVLQRWRAGHGVRSELVVGVTAPAGGFRAHAWLVGDHDAEDHHATMTEILRRPTPPAWLTRS